MNTIKFVSVFVIGLLLLSPYSHAVSKRCAKGVVQSVSVGYGAVNSGSGIRVTINGREYFLYKNNNLNNPMGAALLDLLLISRLTGVDVGLYDNNGRRCKSFQEVVLL